MAKKINIYDIVGAMDFDFNLYDVFPIGRNDALVKLVKIDEEGNEIAREFKTPLSDLFEFYYLYDIKGKQIWNPEHDFERGTWGDED
jgi:hypothetical protein